jgi:hypothetical protein
MMHNTHDAEDGVQDSNSEPGRSPRQTTANNHEEYTSAPKFCTNWNVREGWIQSRVNINRFVVALAMESRLVSSVPVIPGPSIVHHVM